MKFKLVEDFTHIDGDDYTYEDIYKYLNKKYGFSNTPSSGGAQIIDREGKYLQYNKSHGNLLKEMFADNIIKMGKNYLDKYNFVGTNLFTELGFIRCNNHILQYNYLQIPAKLTGEQIDTIKDWLDKYFAGKGYTVIDISNESVDGNVNAFIPYTFEIDDQHQVDDLIKMLKRYDITGKLEDVHKYVEDTEKIKDHKWTNKGKEGTHGYFKTKKEADAQRKAMFAGGYKG